MSSVANVLHNGLAAEQGTSDVDIHERSPIPAICFNQGNTSNSAKRSKHTFEFKLLNEIMLKYTK